MAQRRWALIIGLLAGIPTMAYFVLAGIGVLSYGSIRWPSVHYSFIGITLLTMACVAGEGFLEMLRDKERLHRLRFSVFILAAWVPILEWSKATRNLPLLGGLYIFIALAFAVLSALEIIHRDRRDLLPSTVAQWGVLLLLFAAWVMQAVSARLGAGG